MQNTIKVLDELKKINKMYNLSVEQIDDIWADMVDVRVCTPVIGKFSSGKSALVNTLLRYRNKLLKEDITPETAVPAEIVYDEEGDSVCLFYNDGNYMDVEVSEYKGMELNATQITHVRMALNNSVMKKISDVMIVDMPGFESGFEIHNKAIDNYLPQSLAYIVVFPADDMIVRASVGNILKELVLHDMPICVCITKYDKRNDEFDVSLEKLKESLKKYIGNREVKICRTSSFEGDASDVEEFLVGIEERSQEILARKFKGKVLSELEKTENYLRTTLKNGELSESELDEEEERLEKQMAGLNYKFFGERGDFELQISESIKEIKADVEAALEAEESTFVTMAINNQNLGDHVNTVVRNAVTNSVNKRFIPKVEKYLKRVEKCIKGEEIGDVHISFNFDAKQINTGITASVLAVVAGLALGSVLGAIAAGIAFLVSKFSADKKREEQRSAVRAKLRNEVYPQIMREVENGVRMAIEKQMQLINTSIEDELTYQKETLKKAMSDLRVRMSDEKAKKENLVADVQSDLTRIGQLREMIEA